MHRVGVGGRVDRDRLDAELVQRADHAHRDLAAVRDEDAAKQEAGRGAARARTGAGRTRPAARSGRGSSGRPPRLRLDLVHQLHRLEDAERLPGRDRVALLDERRRARLRRAVEGADHRRLDADEPFVTGGALAGSSSAPPSVAAAPERARRRRAVRSTAGPRRACRLLDRHLADAGLLDDADDLADPLRRATARPRGLERVVAAGAAANRPQQRLRVLAEEPDEQQLLLARGEALRLLAHVLERDRLLLGDVVGRRARRPARTPGRRPGGVPYAPETSSRSSSTTVR